LIPYNPPIMNTRLLMSLSAAFLAAAGVGITFLPQELLTYAGGRPEGTLVLLVQLLGASYLGAAALNWMSRGNRMGGIYGRPVTMANLLHFFVGALALVKATVVQPVPVEVMATAAVYSVFGTWFGLVLFTHPTDDLT
jgi:hypothetical protein